MAKQEPKKQSAFDRLIDYFLDEKETQKRRDETEKAKRADPKRRERIEQGTPRVARRHWEVDLTLLDADGNPVQGAVLQAADPTQGIFALKPTDENGQTGVRIARDVPRKSVRIFRGTTIKWLLLQ